MAIWGGIVGNRTWKLPNKEASREYEGVRDNNHKGTRQIDTKTSGKGRLCFLINTSKKEEA